MSALRKFIVTITIEATSIDVAHRKALRMVKARKYARLDWIESYEQTEGARK